MGLSYKKRSVCLFVWKDYYLVPVILIFSLLIYADFRFLILFILIIIAGCIPDNYQSLTETRGAFVSDFLSVDINANTTYSDIESVLGPGLNLPDKITFPTEPSDIIEAIQHA